MAKRLKPQQLEQHCTAPRTFDNLTDADAWLAGVRPEITLKTWVSPRQCEAEERQVKVAGVTVAELVEYKGLTRYIDATEAWLAKHDEAEQPQPRLS